MSREMKHSGIPWIGEIPKEWETDTIGNLYTLRNEKVRDKKYIFHNKNVWWCKSVYAGVWGTFA